MEDTHISWEIRERHQTAKCLPDGNPTFMTDYPRWFKHQTWSPAVKSRGKWSRPEPSLPCNPQWRGFDFSGWGRVCSTLLAAVRNRSQMFAARPWWRPNGKSGHFWRFQTSRNVVSCGRRGTSWQFNSWKCASRNNGAHFVRHPNTSKNGPRFFGCIVPGICSNVLLAKTSKILPSGKLT